VRLHLKKPFIKIGLVEWLNVKALSSSPNNTHTLSPFQRTLTFTPPQVWQLHNWAQSLAPSTLSNLQVFSCVYKITLRIMYTYTPALFAVKTKNP
jgi:hypothetical protein